MHCSNYRTVYFCNIVAERIEEKLKKFEDDFLKRQTSLSLVKDFSTKNFNVEGYLILIEDKDKVSKIHEMPLEFRIGIRKIAIRHQVPILTHSKSKEEAQIYFLPQICLS